MFEEPLDDVFVHHLVFIHFANFGSKNILSEPLHCVIQEFHEPWKRGYN